MAKRFVCAAVRPRQAITGFTLMELLVVLTIVGLLAAMAFEASWHWVRIGEATARQSEDMRQAALSRQWFGRAIEGLRTSEDGGRRFAGDDRSLRGESVWLPGAARGRALPFELRLARDAALGPGSVDLVLQVGDQPPVKLARLEGDWRFTYVSGTDPAQTVERWPPANDERDELPLRIVLDGAAASIELPWVGAVQQTRRLIPRPSDAIGPR